MKNGKRSPGIEVGSVVRLKSGGPKMTVIGVYPGGSVICVWIDLDTIRRTALCEGKFPMEGLRLLE